MLWSYMIIVMNNTVNIFRLIFLANALIINVDIG